MNSNKPEKITKFNFCFEIITPNKSIIRLIPIHPEIGIIEYP